MVPRPIRRRCHGAVLWLCLTLLFAGALGLHLLFAAGQAYAARERLDTAADAAAWSAALWQARRDVVARLRATAEALRGTPAEEHAIPTLAASAIDLLPPETGRDPSDADPWRALSGALDVLTRWSDGARSEAATAREAARIAAAALADLIG